MVLTHTVFNVLLRKMLQSLMNKEEVFGNEGDLRRRLEEECGSEEVVG